MPSENYKFFRRHFLWLRVVSTVNPYLKAPHGAMDLIFLNFELCDRQIIKVKIHRTKYLHIHFPQLKNDTLVEVQEI